jgi:hypothetical protein
MRIVVLAATLAALLAAPAEADTWLVPSDGATRPASSWPNATPFEMTEFTIYWDEYDQAPYDFDIEIATSPDTDDDGTLDDANVIDRYEAPLKPGYDDIFAARTSPDRQWVATPGTYYWQAFYEEDDGTVGAQDVRSLTIVPAPPPDPPQQPVAPAPYIASPPPAPPPQPLGPALARAIVRRTITSWTRRLAHGLAYRCATVPGAATCRPSWYDARHRYRGTLKIASGVHGIVATFSGTRTVRSCARRCTRRVSWATAM